MILRQEKTKDYAEISKLITLSVKDASFKHGDDDKLVENLRNSKNYIPELSLVAEENGKIIGFILFTQARVKDEKILNLAPLVVHPDFQNQGVGKALLKKGHEIALKLGYDFIVAIGNNTYFPKFGYVEASFYGIDDGFIVPSNKFLAIHLNDGKKNLHGVVEIASEFFE